MENFERLRVFFGIGDNIGNSLICGVQYFTRFWGPQSLCPFPLGPLPRSPRGWYFDWVRGWKSKWRENVVKTLPKFLPQKLQRNAKIFVFSVEFLPPDWKMSDCCKELLLIVDKCKTRLFCVIFLTKIVYIQCLSLMPGNFSKHLTVKLFVVNSDNSENPEFGKDDVLEVVSFALSWPQR